MSYFPSMNIKDGSTDRAVNVTYLSALKVEQTTRLVGPQFTGTTIDTNFWTATTGSGGTATQAGGKVVLATTSTSGSNSQLRSVRRGRFLFANPNIYRGAIKLGDTGVANNVRQWGAFDDNNGYFFRLSGNTFSVVIRKNASDANAISSGSFNGVSSTHTLDTNVHAYEILYFVMKVEFYIDGVLIHTFTPATDHLVDDLTVPITVSNVNTGSVTSGNIEVLSTSIIRIGKEVSRPAYYNLNTNSASPIVLKRGSGTLHRIITNSSGASSNILTVYDNVTTASPTIAIVNTNNTAGAGALEFGLDFYTGLTVVLNGGASAGNVTVVYD